MKLVGRCWTDGKRLLLVRVRVLTSDVNLLPTIGKVPQVLATTDSRVRILRIICRSIESVETTLPCDNYQPNNHKCLCNSHKQASNSAQNEASDGVTHQRHTKFGTTQHRHSDNKYSNHAWDTSCTHRHWEHSRAIEATQKIHSLGRNLNSMCQLVVGHDPDKIEPNRRWYRTDCTICHGSLEFVWTLNCKLDSRQPYLQAFELPVQSAGMNVCVCVWMNGEATTAEGIGEGAMQRSAGDVSKAVVEPQRASLLCSSCATYAKWCLQVRHKRPDSVGFTKYRSICLEQAQVGVVAMTTEMRTGNFGFCMLSDNRVPSKFRRLLVETLILLLVFPIPSAIFPMEDRKTEETTTWVRVTSGNYLLEPRPWLSLPTITNRWFRQMSPRRAAPSPSVVISGDFYEKQIL